MNFPFNIIINFRHGLFLGAGSGLSSFYGYSSLFHFHYFTFQWDSICLARGYSDLVSVLERTEVELISTIQAGYCSSRHLVGAVGCWGIGVWRLALLILLLTG